MNYNKKITILVWLYYTDLTSEFYSLLKPLEKHANIRVSICGEQDNTHSISSLAQLSNVESIRFFSNIGADIYSFLDELQYIHTPYFIKLHSKKSVWGTHRHCHWRSILLDSFIGDMTTLTRNIEILSNNTGYLSCYPFTYNNYESRSSYKISELLQILNINSNSIKSKKFSGGNMFGGNTALFRQIFVPNLSVLQDILSKESGKVNEGKDGTYCHALERIFGYIGCTNKYRLRYSAPSLIKIVVPKIDNKILYFRKLYNNHIYCYNQANIFGDILKCTDEHILINWLHSDKQQINNYTKVAKNTYINDKFIH